MTRLRPLATALILFVCLLPSVFLLTRTRTQVVRDYIDVHVADNELGLFNYSLSTPYPKRTFDDPSISLQDAGLHSADTIYITDLDA